MIRPLYAPVTQRLECHPYISKRGTKLTHAYGHVTQRLECHPYKVEVDGSIPSMPTGMWKFFPSEDYIRSIRWKSMVQFHPGAHEKK